MTDKNKENEFEQNSESDSNNHDKSTTNPDIDNTSDINQNQSEDNLPENPKEDSQKDLYNKDQDGEVNPDETKVEHDDEINKSEDFPKEDSSSEDEMSVNENNTDEFANEESKIQDEDAEQETDSDDRSEVDVIEENVPDITNDEHEDSTEATPAEETPQEKEDTSLEKPNISNYQISLVGEDELSVIVNTNRSVEIESTSKDNDSPLNQKLLISKGKDNSKREIEIRIKILGDDGNETIIEPVKPGVLIPNPEVADLIVKETAESSQLTDEEKLSLKIGKNSPHQKLRQVYEKNLKVGTVGAIIIYLIAIIAFAAYGKSKSNPTSQDIQSRLVIIEDTPPRVNLENLEDPGRPPEEELSETDSKDEGIVPRRIPLRRSPIRPRTSQDFSRDIGTIDTAGIDTATLTGLDTIGGGDTASGKELEGMEREFAENEIGLKFNYPDSWNVISISEIDKNKKGFEGVVIADTTLQPGNLNIFITVDNQDVEFSRTKFEDDFEMLTENVMAFKSRPFFAGDDATYEYFMFFPEHKLHIRVSIKEIYYEQMKDVIDQSIKTINIQKPTNTTNTTTG